MPSALRTVIAGVPIVASAYTTICPVKIFGCAVAAAVICGFARRRDTAAVTRPASIAVAHAAIGGILVQSRMSVAVEICLTLGGNGAVVAEKALATLTFTAI
jgi:UDP-N-acetylglucosamine transferase subunit ALG13